MKYIIFDLEFNSAFRIDRKTKRLMKGNSNPLCPQEIIEIGAVKVNQDYEIESTFEMYVRPQLYEKLHPKVKQKTNISPEDLITGKTLAEAIEAFQSWINEEEFTLCSWGRDDINELKRNCNYFKIDTDWIQNYVDIQKLCMVFLEAPKGNQIGLKNAVETFNIEIEYKFHKALNDSIYTAKILKVIKESPSTGMIKID